MMQMSDSALILLMLAFSPLMANGKPAEATEPEVIKPVSSSRDSRQMMLPLHAPYYYVPYPAQYHQQQFQQQPLQPNFQQYGDLLNSLDSGTKQRLISTLMTFAEKFKSNEPFDISGFKSQSPTNAPGEMPLDLSAFLNDQGQFPLDLQNATPEEIKALVESRVAFGTIANIAVQYLVQALVQAILAQIMAALG